MTEIPNYGRQNAARIAAAKPRPFKLKSPRVSEKAVQAGIVAMLKDAGYTVLELGQKRRPVICKSCKAVTWPTYTDSTTGTPDLMITHTSWHFVFEWKGKSSNVWHALEIKGDGTPRRQEQVDLVNAGMSVFITSDREAAQDVLAFERRLGVTPNKRLSAWLSQGGGETK